jgi:hypothetical protein
VDLAGLSVEPVLSARCRRPQCAGRDRPVGRRTLRPGADQASVAAEAGDAGHQKVSERPVTVGP